MLTVVTGPPCSGKSTYVAQHSRPGDIIVDMDRIALAIAHPDTNHHDYPTHVRHAARMARNAVATAVLHHHEAHGFRAWLIECSPSKEARRYYRQRGATIHTMTTDRQTCLERAATQRPPEVARVIDQWFRDASLVRF